MGIFRFRSTASDNLLELDDLLRAPACALGIGTVGTTFKTTLHESGVELVVKRVDGVDLSKREFEKRVTMIGAIQSEHIVPLRAYFHVKNEVLLLYDNFPMSSLEKALHGIRVYGLDPLNWEQRLAISLDAARGVAHIHSAGPSSCHGNIKSSNILLTGTHDARVSEHGLITLGKFSNASGYHAPEVTNHRRVSQKTDVYSFGVLLLELLTGKAPVKTYLKEAVDLPRLARSLTPAYRMWEAVDKLAPPLFFESARPFLQLAIRCCSEDANLRPTMFGVVQQIEEMPPFISSPFADIEEHFIFSKVD